MRENHINFRENGKIFVKYEEYIKCLIGFLRIQWKF